MNKNAFNQSTNKQCTCQNDHWTINIIDENTFALINKYKRISLKRTRTKLFAYGSKQQLPVIGKFEAGHNRDKKTNDCLYYSCSQRQLWFTVKLSNVTGNDKIEQCQYSLKDKMDKTFPHLFHGIGKLHNFEASCILILLYPLQHNQRVEFHFICEEKFLLLLNNWKTG